MKTLRIMIAVGCIFVLSAGTYAAEFNSYGDVLQVQYSVQDTLVYTVYGMDCPGCAGGLVKQVKKIESIKFAEAFWARQELKIVLKQDSVLDTEELEKRIKKANFTLATESGKIKKNEK
ncbi:MAG: hypothetical protein WD052_00995 [Bacteroidales bacterium]